MKTYFTSDDFCTTWFSAKIKVFIAIVCINNVKKISF